MGKGLRYLYSTIIQKIYFLNFNIVYRFIVYLQRRMIFKKRIVLKIKNHFSKILEDFEYTTILPTSKITFDEYEKEFLTNLLERSKKEVLEQTKGMKTE